MKANEEILAQIARDVRTIAANIEHLTVEMCGSKPAAPAEVKDIKIGKGTITEDDVRKLIESLGDNLISFFGDAEDVDCGYASEVGSDRPRRRVRRAHEHTSA